MKTRREKETRQQRIVAYAVRFSTIAAALNILAAGYYLEAASFAPSYSFARIGDRICAVLSAGENATLTLSPQPLNNYTVVSYGVTASKSMAEVCQVSQEIAVQKPDTPSIDLNVVYREEAKGTNMLCTATGISDLTCATNIISTGFETLNEATKLSLHKLNELLGATSTIATELQQQILSVLLAVVVDPRVCEPEMLELFQELAI